MTIELDGRLMTDRGMTHDDLRQKLSLPEYYGRNLDALYDLLTERQEPTTIIVRHRREMERHLGSYAQALLKTLCDAARANPRLQIAEE